MTERRRGRPPKFSADDLRDRLLIAARRALRDRGPGLGLDNVTLDAAIIDAGVPRGSAYRLWQQDGVPPQQVFRRELALDILRSTNDRQRLAVDVTKESLDLLIGELQGDDETRLWAFCQVIRVVANTGFGQLTESREWPIYNALRTAILGQTPPVAPALDAIRRGERQLIDSLTAVVTDVAGRCGLRVRDPFTMEDFVEAALMMTEGSGTRLTSSERAEPFLRPTGIDGEMQEWTLLGVGVEALARSFFEVDQASAAAEAQGRAQDPQSGLESQPMTDSGGEYEPSTWQWVADQVAEYEASGGTRANTLRDTGIPIIIVTMVGHKSGKIRKIALMRVEHHGEYALVASKGGAPEHPGWYHNLVADPRVQIQDGPEPQDYTVRIVDGDERQRWWDRSVSVFARYAEYEEKTDRIIPVFVASPA